jgi:hypothetical protein
MRFTALAMVAALALPAPRFPSIPALPSNQWWRAETAKPFAGALMAQVKPAGDRMARDAVARSGYEPLLFPPLPCSIILNGGYRCASNEVRER